MGRQERQWLGKGREAMLAALENLPQVICKTVPKLYLLYREYGLQETILIVLGIVFCVWLFERV